MKHILIPAVLGMAALIVGFVDIPYKSFIFALLAILIVLHQLLLFQLIINRKIEGQLKIRSQKRSISISWIMMALTWTLFFLIDGKDDPYGTILFWIFVTIEIAGYFLYKRWKPITLAINSSEILVNDIFLVKRNLEGLTKLDLNGITKKLACVFHDSPAVTINYGDYLKKDIEEVIDLMIRTSKQNVELSDNLKKD